MGEQEGDEWVLSVDTTGYMIPYSTIYTLSPYIQRLALWMMLHGDGV